LTTESLKRESLDLLENIADGVAVTGPDGGFRFLSKRLSHSLGIEAALSTPKSAFSLLTSTTPEPLPMLHAKAHGTGSPQRTTLYAHRRDLFARVIMRGAVFEGERCVFWTFEDMQDQRPVLPNGQSCLELVVRRADFGFWDVNVATDELTWWNDWCEQHDIESCVGQGHCRRWDANIHPDDLDKTAAYHAVVAGDRELYESEFRVRTKSGGWRWVVSRGMVTMRDAKGRALRITGVTIDIDARKRAELALRESEARLEAAVWGTEIGLWEIRSDGSCWWFNEWCEMHDIQPYDDGHRRRTWIERIHPDDAALYERLNGQCLRGESEHYVVEFRIVARDGSWRWVHERGRVTERDASGAYRVAVGVCFDIDARKRTEITVRENEARLAMILQTMSEGVVLISAEGRIEFTNPAFDRMFGYRPGELNGLSVFELLALKHRVKRRSRAIERLLARFNAQAGRRTMAFRRRDGADFPGEVLTGTIEVAGLQKRLYVIRDVLERKLLEKEITEIAHRERRRIGSDLHDGLGQELTGISLLLRSLAQRTRSNHEPHDAELDEIIGLVNHAIQTTRTMAMGMSPVTLEYGGIVSALLSLAAWTRSTLGCEVRLRRALRHPVTLDEANSTHLYLIAQEAILNAVKHGEARSILVTLSTTNDVVSLAISDDGIGIANGPRLGEGMGLKIMEYRASVMGGSLQIKQRKGGGTRVHCVCPRSAVGRNG
jgi:PAS domain S-box-containing protein